MRKSNSLSFLSFLIYLFLSLNGYPDSNVDEINRLLKITPSDAELYFQRGYLYYSHDNFSKAAEDFTSCVRLQPAEMLYHFYKAMADMKSLRLRASIEGFKTVLQLKPDYAEAFFYLGILHSRVNEYKQSAEAFDSALSLNNTVAKYWAARANLKKETASVEDAISDYEQALEIDPDFAIVHYELAWIHFNRHDMKQALKHAERLVTLEVNPMYFHTLACIYSIVDIKKAIENEIKAFDLDRNSEYEDTLKGFKDGMSFTEQKNRMDKIQNDLRQKNEMERIRKEKIWEKIVENNKVLNSPRNIQ